jgi:hypothetical protein
VLSSGQLVKQRLRLFQIERVENARAALLSYGDNPPKNDTTPPLFSVLPLAAVAGRLSHDENWAFAHLWPSL